MTRIQLNAETLAQFQSADGRVLLCDEAGNPVQYVEVESYPDREPSLSAEEWKRRAAETGGLTTPQLIEFLKTRGGR